MSSGLSPGIETKVGAPVAANGLLGFVTAELVTYLPVFHSGIPEPVAVMLPWFIGWVSAAVTGWYAKHTPRPEAITAEVERQLTALAVARSVTLVVAPGTKVVQGDVPPAPGAVPGGA